MLLGLCYTVLYYTFLFHFILVYSDFIFKAVDFSMEVYNIHNFLSHSYISPVPHWLHHLSTSLLYQLVNERDEEITRIAKSIEELAQIFKELAVLVIDQGTILDRIDFNMESAVEHATVGISELTKAETNQKNALPMRCIIVLVVLIAIMLIVLVVKNSPQKSSN